MLQIFDPWWMTDKYYNQVPIPTEIDEYAGPNGIALVKTWNDGTTSAGWGLVGKNGNRGFMENYRRKEFAPKRSLFGYERGKHAFAFVMRSLSLVAIDIDGKNGGIDHAEELIAGAPPTLAETSKSGNGYHLFYSVEDDWDETLGFGKIPDSVGIVTGVDIRGVGCVYHHDTQRWNGRKIAPLPKHIEERLLKRQRQRNAESDTIKKIIETQDTEEILIMQDNLIDDLNSKRVEEPGKRNNMLFAIGSKMKEAEIDNWEQLVADRAIAVGLSSAEAEKIVNNITDYS